MLKGISFLKSLLLLWTALLFGTVVKICFVGKKFLLFTLKFRIKVNESRYKQCGLTPYFTIGKKILWKKNIEKR